MKSKKIQVALLCLGLINSDLVYSNPIKDTAILLYACVGNWLHLVNLKDEMMLHHQLEHQFESDEQQLATCQDVDRKKVIEAQRQYKLTVDVGVWPKASMIENSSNLLASGIGTVTMLASAPHLSDPLPMTAATVNLLVALPMRYVISRGQSRLNQVKKEADSITIDTLQAYKNYLDLSVTEKDVKIFDVSNGRPVHKTDFASQANGNVLIAKDKKLNEKVLDAVFSGKKSECEDSLDDRNELRALRKITISENELLPFPHLADNFISYTKTTKRVYDVQGDYIQQQNKAVYNQAGDLV